jgi:preprotein translocase subunit SecA
VFFSSWEDEVVTSNLEDNKLPMQTDDGRMSSEGVAGCSTTRRVAEGGY